MALWSDSINGLPIVACPCRTTLLIYIKPAKGSNAQKCQTEMQNQLDQI
jgi:hypothetical protein